jgi:tetratricopeptide (TPR) repeat protein
MKTHRRLLLTSLLGGLLAMLASSPVLAQRFTLSTDEFAIVPTNPPALITLMIQNNQSPAAVVNAITFKDPALINATPLPLNIGVGAGVAVSVRATIPASRYHTNICIISYNAGGAGSFTGAVAIGLFLDDGSERAFDAHRALTAFQNARSYLATSSATHNNRGVLFRLLGERSRALTELGQAYEAREYGRGVAGIRMNEGIVFSDDGQPDVAMGQYSSALSELATYNRKWKAKSVLTPQISYNQSWEYYTQGDLASAASVLKTVLTHPRAGKYLKAKARVLSAAIAVAQNKPKGAKLQLKLAAKFDPTGPIGDLARANLAYLETMGTAQ